MIGTIAASSSRWEKTKFGFQVERACERTGVFFIYLSSQHILSITPLVKKAWEQASVTDFAIFIFSAQLNSDTDQSDKPKTPKFILLHPWSNLTNI